MKIAQTTSACKRFLGENQLLDTAAYYARLGYTGVDFSFMDAARAGSENPLQKEHWRDWALGAKEELQRIGIPAVQSHAPIFNAFSSDVPELDKKIEMTKRTLAASGLLGVPWVVIHPNTDYGNNRPSINMKKNREYFRPLLELAMEYQTGIAIENMFDTYHHPVGVSGSSEKSDRRADHHLIAQRRFGTNPEELLELVDSLYEEFPNVGVCWDFGHANEAGLWQAESLKLLGKRIQALHVNDNTAVFDDHLTPFCGSVPWKEVMFCLEEIGYQGAFTFENTKFISKVPDALLDAALGYSLTVAKYLTGLIS